MTNEQLKSLLAVVENGSFRSAAKAIHKTQSTVSASVKSLEDELGIELLDRKDYRPNLTPAGKAFVEKAKRVVGDFDRLMHFGKQLADGDDPSLAIVISGMCALPPILGLLRKNIQAFPITNFTLTTEHMSGVLEALNQKRAEIAIGPDKDFDWRHQYAQIGSIQIMNVASPILVSSVKQPISQNAIRDKVHILVDDTGKEHPKRHLNTIPGEKVWKVNDYSNKKALILAGLGWGRLPLHMVEKELDTGQLQQIRIEGIENTQAAPIFISRLRERSPGRVAQSVWEQFEKFGGMS